MKTLKLTVIAIVLFGSFTACVNEEMDDDMLVAPDNVEGSVFTGGGIDEV
ncbi:hypothetical protein [Formosa sp. PL04]|nr:hypothetical protein [Formosa sp. PL04]MDW5289243.1 hypothetical protein [Formosa sp. PL04]